MLELNPKLQGKVLDSLLLHMQAERKAPRASKGGRTARGKAQRPQKPQRPGKEKSAPASGIAPAWGLVAGTAVPGGMAIGRPGIAEGIGTPACGCVTAVDAPTGAVGA